MPSKDDEVCIKVLDECLNLLATEQQWSPKAEFGEPCDFNGDRYTFGCALEKAQLMHRGEKVNRSQEMRTVRRKIYQHFFWRAGIHPVTYFSRHRKTTHEDILFVLNEARKKFTD